MILILFLADSFTIDLMENSSAFPQFYELFLPASSTLSLFDHPKNDMAQKDFLHVRFLRY
jgi:hypothetical protein